MSIVSYRDMSVNSESISKPAIKIPEFCSTISAAKLKKIIYCEIICCQKFEKALQILKIDWCDWWNAK